MAEAVKPTCGIVMPISAIDGCDEGHWAEVLAIITDAANVAGFDARLVSQSDEVGVIQKNIIQNLYQNEIVICDVSGKNANVMFELGMRLAFDKPTIIIKDDATSYSFDTSPVEHLGYPRDLRFTKIVTFKQVLASKIKSTCEAAAKQPNYSPFLKHFGDFTVAKIDTKEIGAQEYILAELSSINAKLALMHRRSQTADEEPPRRGRFVETFKLEAADADGPLQLSEALSMVPGVSVTKVSGSSNGAAVEVRYNANNESTLSYQRDKARSIYARYLENPMIFAEIKK